MSKEKDFIDKLNKTEKPELTIAHWCIFAPKASGMYETTKELIQYENQIPGVFAGLVEANNKEGGRLDRSSDPPLVTQSRDWAMRDADLHMIHSTLAGVSKRLEPNVFFMHGSPEACLWAEMSAFDTSFSMSSAISFMERSEYTIVFQKRHKYMWEPIDPGKVRLVQKGVDLERWRPSGMKMKLEGKPKVLYGEVWRVMKDPLVLFYAMNELYNINSEARFHPWALGNKRRMWEAYVGRAGWHKFLGKYLISGSQAYPEQWYRGGHMLVSPTLLGEPSRVLQECLACGTPTITWDCNDYGDTVAFKKARPFDPVDLAHKMQELWEEMQKDEKGVRRKARRLAEKNYSMKVMADQVVAIAREAVNKAK